MLYEVITINLWGENYTGQLFTEGDGLPQRYVYTLNQDYQDFIWLGTDQGVITSYSIHYTKLYED